MPKITVDKFHDKEAVLDADRPEDSDFLHKLEVNELSRNSVCIGFINWDCQMMYYCHSVLQYSVWKSDGLIRKSRDENIKYAMFCYNKIKCHNI